MAAASTSSMRRKFCTSLNMENVQIGRFTFCNLWTAKFYQRNNNTFCLDVLQHWRIMQNFAEDPPNRLDSQHCFRNLILRMVSFYFGRRSGLRLADAIIFHVLIIMLYCTMYMFIILVVEKKLVKWYGYFLLIRFSSFWDWLRRLRRYQK